ncbi:Sarcosine oxidase subunit gamma [Nymphon striatum]|nr:Sarcosine oxidase subunit gamma [Nymphon striatum]
MPRYLSMHHVAEKFPAGNDFYSLEEQSLGHLILRASDTNQSVDKAIKKVTKLDLPRNALSSASNESFSINWIAPDEWLILTKEKAEWEVESTLRKAMDGHYANCECTGGQTVLELSGERAETILKKSSTYDVHITNFPVGKVVTTVFAKSQVVLKRTGENHFQLIVRRSFSDYIWQWIKKTTLAITWLEIIDQGKYEESWNKTAPIFQQYLTSAEWNEALKKARKPFGKLLSRSATEEKAHDSLPGAPSGKYIVIKFSTKFENKASAIETVTLKKDQSIWRVAGLSVSLLAIAGITLLASTSQAQSPVFPPEQVFQATTAFIGLSANANRAIMLIRMDRWDSNHLPITHKLNSQQQGQQAQVQKPAREFSGFLGIVLDILPEAVSAQLPAGVKQGVLIKEFSPNAPAATSELKPYDVMFAYGDTKLNHPAQFIKIVREDQPGREVIIKVVRKGEILEIPVVIGSQKTPNPQEFNGLAIKQIGKDKYRAIVKFVGPSGNKQVRTYEGNREEIFEQAQYAQDLPQAERQQLLYATRPRNNNSN